jgi:hypothetical protein
VGAAFFGNYYLIDFELMGGNARQAITDEGAKLKITPTPLPAGAIWLANVDHVGVRRKDTGRSSLRPKCPCRMLTSPRMNVAADERHSSNTGFLNTSSMIPVQAVRGAAQ